MHLYPHYKGETKQKSTFQKSRLDITVAFFLFLFFLRCVRVCYSRSSHGYVQILDLPLEKRVHVSQSFHVIGCFFHLVAFF